jgi:NAD(P) transhydrogenase subunit alpha
MTIGIECQPLALLLAGGSTTSYVFIGLWVFLLAIFVGVELITKVPPTLHTPLMSGANAISGITIVGALYCSSPDFPFLGKFLGFLAIVLAMVNVVGGFLVTDRMLGMFSTGQRSTSRAKKDGAKGAGR